jgi:AraC-like DNA-binding protein
VVRLTTQNNRLDTTMTAFTALVDHVPIVIASPLTETLDRSPGSTATMRVWRPLSRELADVICVHSADASAVPQMHERLSVTLLRSRTMVRLESCRSLAVERCSVLLVPPRQLNAARAMGTAPNETLTLLIDSSSVSGLRDDQRPVLTDDTALGVRLATLFGDLHRPVQSIGCADAIRSLLEQVLTYAAPGGIARSSLDEPVSIEALARKGGLTEYHLIRAFHREFGLPPHAYHVRLRLARARELLAGGLTVSRTAYECGFADQSHLSRKFKEVYGLTPATWVSAVSPGRRRRQPERIQQFRSRQRRSERASVACRVVPS